MAYDHGECFLHSLFTFLFLFLICLSWLFIIFLTFLLTIFIIIIFLLVLVLLRSLLRNWTSVTLRQVCVCSQKIYGLVLPVKCATRRERKVKCFLCSFVCPTVYVPLCKVRCHTATNCTDIAFPRSLVPQDSLYLLYHRLSLLSVLGLNETCILVIKQWWTFFVINKVQDSITVI